MPPRRVERFSSSDYRDLLVALKNIGYCDVPLEGLSPSQPHMFVRHDIDLSLEHACQIGKLEAEEGVKSTFYVLVSTPLYNVASAHSRSMLTELLDQGHTVGLHFDATAYRGDRASLERAAVYECELLEQLTGRAVGSISFHRPVREFINMPGTFARRRHTYEPQFFSKVGYISDSNGAWHHGHPLDHPAVTSRSGIQLLTHPIWWMQTERLRAVEVMERLRSARCEADLKALAGTVTAYKDWLSPTV